MYAFNKRKLLYLIRGILFPKEIIHFHGITQQNCTLQMKATDSIIDVLQIPQLSCLKMCLQGLTRIRNPDWHRQRWNLTDKFPSNAAKILLRPSKSGLEYRKRFRVCLLPAILTGVSHLKIQPWPVVIHILTV